MESAFADSLLLFEGFFRKMAIFRENAVFHSKKQRFLALHRFPVCFWALFGQK